MACERVIVDIFGSWCCKPQANPLKLLVSFFLVGIFEGNFTHSDPHGSLVFVSFGESVKNAQDVRPKQLGIKSVPLTNTLVETTTAGISASSLNMVFIPELEYLPLQGPYFLTKTLKINPV